MTIAIHGGGYTILASPELGRHHPSSQPAAAATAAEYSSEVPHTAKANTAVYYWLRSHIAVLASDSVVFIIMKIVHKVQNKTHSNQQPLKTFLNSTMTYTQMHNKIVNATAQKANR